MARRIRAREVLRLRSVNGLSQNAIARTAHVSKLRSGQDRAPAGEASGDCGYVRGAGFYGEE